MIDACKAAGRQLAIGYRCQFDPNHLACVKLARDKTFGDVRMIDAGFRISDRRSGAVATASRAVGRRTVDGRRHLRAADGADDHGRGAVERLGARDENRFERSSRTSKSR